MEGPTRKQVARMRRFVTEKRAAAQAALAAGNDDLAFTLDCAAFDTECVLRDYGYEV